MHYESITHPAQLIRPCVRAPQWWSRTFGSCESCASPEGIECRSIRVPKKKLQMEHLTCFVTKKNWIISLRSLKKLIWNVHQSPVVIFIHPHQASELLRQLKKLLDFSFCLCIWRSWPFRAMISTLNNLSLDINLLIPDYSCRPSGNAARKIQIPPAAFRRICRENLWSCLVWGWLATPSVRCCEPS